MALVLADRIQETTNSTGTGSLLLAGAVTGYQPFSILGGGAQTYFCITDGVNWEVTYGSWINATNTLTRQTVLASSNANTFVNFSAGPKTVFATYPASKAVYLASNGSFRLPQWTTATRPTGPGTGDMGFNTSFGYAEWYDGALWWPVSDQPVYTTDYLVVGGGGGGGQQGGGGGAGGYRAATAFGFSRGTLYSVAVGAGGAANTSGSASNFSTISAAGGGAGGRAAGGSINGSNGGSGGGASVSSTLGTGGLGNTPTVTPSQGNNGGVNVITSGYGGGGGGGASAAGANGTTTAGGAGGAGTSNSITGSAVTYAGGGGGGLFVTGTAGAGGAGGGGAGAVVSGNASSGTVNTGGGGGGTGSTTGTVGAGGSGVVILKYSAALALAIDAGLTYTTVTSGSYKITTFTAGSGNIYWTSA